jgi:hypothetical protein
MLHSREQGPPASAQIRPRLAGPEAAFVTAGDGNDAIISIGAVVVVCGPVSPAAWATCGPLTRLGQLFALDG